MSTATEQRLWNGVQIQGMLDSEVHYKNWRFIVRQRNVEGYMGPQDIVLDLRAEWMGEDAGSGQLEKQQSRWWVLSPWMCKTEIIQTAFLCVLKAEEHEIRETFKYRLDEGDRCRWTSPFNSHIHINELALASERVDVRIDTREEAPANQRRE